MYFDASSTFQGAVICADMHKVVIDSCVSNAVLCYIAVFHVCQVGYNDQWVNFLATLEHVLLGIPFKGGSYKPIKLDNFLHWWQKHLQTTAWNIGAHLGHPNCPEKSNICIFHFSSTTIICYHIRFCSTLAGCISQFKCHDSKKCRLTRCNKM